MAGTKNGISSIGTTLTFLKVGTCSEALINVIDRAFDNPLKLEERASMPLAGGIMRHGYQCGAIWGSVLAAGAQAYRLHGAGPQAEIQAIIAAKRLLESFRARNNNINCLEITATKWQPSIQMFKYFIKGGPIGCVGMAAKFAPEAFSEINSALAEKYVAPPSSPVSCSALLAQKMGASDLHTIMAAGFAGGIGLSGGGCGALGAAIWIMEMNSRKKGSGSNIFKSKADDMIDKFLKGSDFQFQCSKIVGRRFENISDHADYLHNGGCWKIIEILAAQ